MIQGRNKTKNKQISRNGTVSYNEIISTNLVLAFLGLIASILLPIAILVIQDGTDLRIDKPTIIERVLDLSTYIALTFSIFLFAIAKRLLNRYAIAKAIKIITKVLGGIIALLMLCLIIYTFITFQNSMKWLSDTPIALSDENTFTSDSILHSKLNKSPAQTITFVRPTTISSYRKRARLSYINSADTFLEKELRWETFWNDNNTYNQEAKNGLWLYLRDFYLFLFDRKNNQDIVEQGFLSFQEHLNNFGSSVDESNLCLSVSSTMNMLKFENEPWRTALWSKLISKYMTTALIDPKMISSTRVCWLESVPGYFIDGKLDVGPNENFNILMSKLWETYKSDEVTNSLIYIDTNSFNKEYAKEFYQLLRSTASEEEFISEVKDFIQNQKNP